MSSDPTSPLPDTDALAARFASIALEAAVPVLQVYARGAVARLKSDASPVTEADELAEQYILAALARDAPAIPVISEEAASRGEHVAIGDDFILVDPLDGTREFLNRNGEFTINIALIHAGAPVCGAIYAPAVQKLWFAGKQAFAVDAAPGAPLPPRERWRSLHTRTPPVSRVALISRSHLEARSEAFLDALGVTQRLAAGSSLKFCRIAEGAADVYPRFGPTMEWDTAAGDAILRAAGGMVLGEDGAPMRYGHPAQGFRNGGFVAWGRC